MTAEERVARALALQRHALSRGLNLLGSATEEFHRIRSYLIEASEDEQIRDSMTDIFNLLRLKVDRDVEVVTGGQVDRERDGSKPHLTRQDGARLHFTVTLRDGRPAQLEAYSYELVMPGRSPAFLRYELDRAHEGDGLRSHLHPGSDDIRVPVPAMTPLEVLDLLLYGS